MKTLLVPMSLLFILPAAVQAGSLERQHGAHVHGQATGTLAVDAHRLTLSLVMPGMNLVGFEHAPVDDAQREHLHAVGQALQSGGWLEFDPDGECRIDRIELAMPGFDDERHSHDADHAHHHDHGDRDRHRHDVDGHAHRHGRGEHHEHAEFRIEVEIDCVRVQRLSWIELDLFENYPANEEIRMDVLTETRAQQARLRANDSRIQLN